MIGINVGCGTRPLSSTPDNRWINVDLDERIPDGYEYRRGEAITLPFEDGFADEVFSCHVIEHFWPHEVADVVLEWKRVLKPDGMLVVECPNLIKCAQLLVMAEGGEEHRPFVLAMNGFYGDRQQTELPMKHKWGYTPKSMSALFRACGFADVTVGPPQFKQKVRDMRVVGRNGAARPDIPKVIVETGMDIGYKRT